MIVSCPACGDVFDDEWISWNCPGEGKRHGGHSGYCREHDLFACPLHDNLGEMARVT